MPDDPIDKLVRDLGLEKVGYHRYKMGITSPRHARKAIKRAEKLKRKLQKAIEKQNKRNQKG
jgi:hypothetical protein